jgi:hypothetical protein
VVVRGDDADSEASEVGWAAGSRLTRRRRQAALQSSRNAPTWEQPTWEQASGLEPPHGAGERSPEATGNLVASMQRGWQRGRADELDGPGQAPGREPNDSEGG